MFRHQGFKNPALLILLFGILVYSAMQLTVSFKEDVEKYMEFPLIVALDLASENTCHWVIT